jgi:hypothetical protein
LGLGLLQALGRRLPTPYRLEYMSLIAFNLQEEVLKLQDGTTYIENEIFPADLSSKELTVILNGNVERALY